MVSPSIALKIERYCFGIVEDLAVVRQRHAILAVGEHVAGTGIFLQAQAVHRVLVRKLNDLVALHDVETHPRDAGVGLVVHEGVAAVIGAVGERDVRDDAGRRSCRCRRDS